MHSPPMHGGTPSFLTPSGSTQDPDRYMQDLPPDLPTAALFEAIEKVDGRPWFKCRAIGCAMNHSAKQVAEDRMIAHSLCLSGYGVVKCTGTQFFLFDGVEEVRCEHSR